MWSRLGPDAPDGPEGDQRICVDSCHGLLLIQCASLSRNFYTGAAINELLKKSAELEQCLIEFFGLRLYDETERLKASKIVCSIAFEHAESAKILIASGNFTSAIAMVRLQYEALVRSMWLLYSASDLDVTKLMSELTAESAAKANAIPLLSEMLGKLEGKAPAEAVTMLREFKEYSWKPLSSFVHGGIHAIHRHSKGYPKPLMGQLLRISNGVSIMTGMLLVILSGDTRQQGKLPALQKKYHDCLPDPPNLQATVI